MTRWSLKLNKFAFNRCEQGVMSFEMFIFDGVIPSLFKIITCPSDFSNTMGGMKGGKWPFRRRHDVKVNAVITCRD